MASQKDYQKLCQEVWRHNYLYYEKNQPEISDFEFDQLLKKVEAIEKKHPEWVTSHSPTQRVGEAASGGFKVVPHKHPMLSLDNAYSFEELKVFTDRMENQLEIRQQGYSVELKMDGIAVSVKYEKGQFIQAVTRGNGFEGDEITQNMKTVRNLPLSLIGKNIPDTLEVRGEVYMDKKDFIQLNQEREKRDEPLWANPRNATGGSLKLLDPKETARRPLKVVFYTLADSSSEGIQNQMEVFHALELWGLPRVSRVEFCGDLDAVWAFAKKVEKEREQLPFEIDGVVVKVNNIGAQKDLGATRKHLRWAIAYKFAAERGQTVLRDITVQVGRTGTLTPVAELDPVLLAGSTISRATLHNADFVHELGVCIGDTVYIEKGGDVIPKVVEVDQERRPQGAIPWKMPDRCPSCGTPVAKREGEVALRCPNKSGCPSQALAELAFFSGKNGMDIDHLGKKIVAKLLEAKLIKGPADLYILDEEKLASLEGFKEKSIANLLESIEKSKRRPLDRFLVALGIPYVGEGTAELLAQKGETLVGLQKLSLEELLSIDGIGEKVARSVIGYFESPENIAYIDLLLERGVMPQPFTKTERASTPFSGKTVVITGTFAALTRSNLTAKIKAMGGKVSSSISKKTDYLLVGEDPGSKFEKAQKLGVKILREQELIELLQ